ncbi:MAG: hypothetical protein U1F98_14715 [Verrucomicrobiota bacterium]
MAKMNDHAGATPDHPVKFVALKDLEFDLRNPRYGAKVGELPDEKAALNHIVTTFGVQDVLSSLSVNGYFGTEPLVGLREAVGERIKVVEGNRRLAACLILTNDGRAKDQKGLYDRYSALHKQKGSPAISPVPVIVYEGKKGFNEVLPYLGIRHIAGSLPWDSYAKAAWADKTSQSSGYSLSDISQMIGDDSDTVTRLVEGLRFVKQLESTGQFQPEQSLRRGRGSNKQYPFSWVYTALGYSPIRKFAGLKEDRRVISDKPIPTSKLDDAGALMLFMFGNKLKGSPAAMSDSREFGELAKAVDRPDLREKLKQGRSLKQVIEEGRSASDRISEGLVRATEGLTTVSGLIVEGAIGTDEALKLHKLCKEQTIPTARKIAGDLFKIAVGTDGNEEE